MPRLARLDSPGVLHHIIIRERQNNRVAVILSGEEKGKKINGSLNNQNYPSMPQQLSQLKSPSFALFILMIYVKKLELIQVASIARYM